MNSVIIGIGLFLFMTCRSSMANYQDKEFVPYVEEFIRFSKMADKSIASRARNLSVVFDKIEPEYAAKYMPFDNVIIVNKESWKTLKVPEREELIFHELGHAVLFLGHTDKTIMQAAGMLGERFYKRYYTYLLNTHFGCFEKPCITESYNDNKYTQNKEKLVTKAEVLQNEHAVIRFTATWCPPCKALAPVFDEVAAAHPDVKTYIVDVDQNPDLARDLNVRGIPTCMAIRNNAVSETLVGNQPKPELEKLFK